MDKSLGIGPVDVREVPWRARLRYHAAWYRHHVLREPFGDAPHPVNRPLGNMLNAEAAKKGVNFVSEEAYDAYKRRRTLGWGVDPTRCTRNLLSSQALTLNIFGSLQANQIWLANVVRIITGNSDVDACEAYIEYAPRPMSTFLNDRTIIDTLVTYTLGDSRGSLVFEVKHTDRYASRVVPIAGNAHYVDLMSRTNYWKSLPAGRDLNQLLRVHMLASRIAEQSAGARLLPPILVLLHHDLDPNAVATMQDYKSHLTGNGYEKAAALPLSQMLQAMLDGATNYQERDVSDRLLCRYSVISQSEEAWASR